MHIRPVPRQVFHRKPFEGCWCELFYKLDVLPACHSEQRQSTKAHTIKLRMMVIETLVRGYRNAVSSTAAKMGCSKERIRRSIYFLYLRFNGHFPGGPGLSRYQNVSILDFIGAKYDVRGGNGDVQSSSQNITTNKPTPSFCTGRPTNSVKTLKGKNM